ncbi:MAG: hypothetical protein H0X05_03810 [Actinobacteria bacterium]|nr:hypothetical protein [Actinomycetota bacterium]
MAPGIGVAEAEGSGTVAFVDAERTSEVSPFGSPGAEEQAATNAASTSAAH